jgi:hypothetical protein
MLPSLWSSSKYSDLILKLKDGTKLKVHKSVLCRFDFFRAASEGTFKVSIHASLSQINI